MAGSDSQVENEVKLRVPDAESARVLLEKSGYTIRRARVFETNAVYDTPARNFQARGELIRIREVEGSGVLTFKGVAIPGRHKQRPEFETSLGQPSVLRMIFERLGLQPRFRYEKYRTEYERPGERGIVTLDETPIGVFLELEGGPEWLDQAARELGFSPADYILKSYGTLYLEYCDAHGFERGHMTF